MLKTSIAILALALAASVAHAEQQLSSGHHSSGHIALANGSISPNVSTRPHSRGVSTHVTVFRHRNGELGYRVRFMYSGSGGVQSWPTAPDGSPLGTPPGFTPNQQ